MPPNELGVSVPAPSVLGRSEDAVVVLETLKAFSSGVLFGIHVRMRVGPRPRDVADGGPRPGGPFSMLPTTILFGLELSDGTAVTLAAGRFDTDPLVEPGAATLVMGTPNFDERAANWTYYLNPLPPDGPVRLYVAAPDLGVPETVTVVDGSALRRASVGAEILWHEPDVEDPGDSGRSIRQEIRPGSWFDRNGPWQDRR